MCRCRKCRRQATYKEASGWCDEMAEMMKNCCSDSVNVSEFQTMMNTIMNNIKNCDFNDPKDKPCC